MKRTFVRSAVYCLLAVVGPVELLNCNRRFERSPTARASVLKGSLVNDREHDKLAAQQRQAEPNPHVLHLRRGPHARPEIRQIVLGNHCEIVQEVSLRGLWLRGRNFRATGAGRTGSPEQSIFRPCLPGISVGEAPAMSSVQKTCSQHLTAQPAKDRVNFELFRQSPELK